MDVEYDCSSPAGAELLFVPPPPCTATCHLQLLFNISRVIVNCDFHHSEVQVANPKQDRNAFGASGTLQILDARLAVNVRSLYNRTVCTASRQHVSSNQGHH